MEPLGIQVLKARGFFPHAYWYWIGTGALLGFILLFNVVFNLALTYLNRNELLTQYIPFSLAILEVFFHIGIC